MRKTHPLMMISAMALAACAVLTGADMVAAKPVELSRETVLNSYEFTRGVLAGCPTEKAELDEETQIVTIFYPREEYRDLRERLERQGWQEQGEQSGKFTYGDDAILVERGKLTILPRLAQR